MEEKLTCIFSGPMRSDACSHNQYKSKKTMTVKEVCDYAIHSDNWGRIEVKDNGKLGYHRIDYYEHKYCDKDRNPKDLDFPEEVLNAYVELIDWDGGWGCGDWELTLVGDPSLLPQRDYFVPPMTKAERIERRIRSMSNEELERYILESKARKIMLEEEYK